MVRGSRATTLAACLVALAVASATAWVVLARSPTSVLSPLADTALAAPVTGPLADGRGDSEAAPMAVQGELVAAFYYQGFLTEDDAPVTGTREMEFQLWSKDKIPEQVSVTLNRTVQVQDGQFSTSLGWGRDEFDGRGLELQVRVQDASGTWHSLGRESILAVPYAMSLIPGANIEREAGPHVLHLANQGGSGLTSTADADAVYGLTTGDDDGSAGVKGQSSSTHGESKGGSFSSVLGVGAYGASLGNHGVQGHGGSLDGNYGGYFTGDGGVYAEATGSRSGDAGHFVGDVSISDSLDVDGPVVMTGDIWGLTVRDRLRSNTVHVTSTIYTGALVVEGPSFGSFVRPEWDSEWQSIGRGSTATYTHDIGGDPSDYVADFQCRDTTSGGMGIHIFGIGGLSVTQPPAPVDSRGAYYRNLTSSSVKVYRLPDDDYCDQVRVRLWLIR